MRNFSLYFFILLLHLFKELQKKKNIQLPDFLNYRLLNNLLRALSIIYNDSQLCRWENTCYSIEPDLTTLMKTTRDPAQLLWAWHGWRSSTGQITYQIYPSLITLQNQAAQNNGTIF